MKKLLALATIIFTLNLVSTAQCDATYTYTNIDCDSVWFIPVSTGSQFTYSWDFGDGDTSTDASPTHTYTSDNTYFVVLQVFDTVAMCSDVLTVAVTIDCTTPCSVNSAWTWFPDSLGCEANFISTAITGSPPYSYFWDFGDGSTSTLANPTHAYNNLQVWNVCLTVTDGLGCDTTMCDIITLGCAPTSCDAQFNYTYSACDSVLFFPLSQGSQYTYLWDFGDGNTSTDMYPTNVFASDGSYPVILTLSDTISGCSDVLTVLVNVNCGTSCAVNGAFAWNVDSVNCNVNFVSTAFGGTAPYTYFWSFGDGNTSADAHPTHQYPNNSVWTPCLTITDALGCDTTICDIITVSCVASSCDAQFTYTNVGCDSILFFPASAGSQYTYNWDFGDGNSSTDTYAGHTYGSNGVYVVILTLSDTVAGCTDFFTLTINVNCGVSPCTLNGAFAWNVDSVNCNVNFISTAFGGTQPYSYFWNFGDGNVSSLPHPVHSYPNNSVWTPCLTITDDNGCDTTICDIVMVNCNPVSCDAFFTATALACDEMIFTATNNGSQFVHFWDFGDGDTSTDAVPTHTWTSDGVYIVWHYVEDTITGCTDSTLITYSIFCGNNCTVNGAFAWNIDSTNCDVNFVSTAFGGTAPYSYFWNFGDGNTSTQAHPTYAYPNNSTWTPCLTITDSQGCDTTICDVVFVTCSPDSCDALYTYSFAACDSVFFFPVSLGGPNLYLWDFGDGNTSTDEVPGHQYAADGVYITTLTITDTLTQCTATITVPLTINCGTNCTVNAVITWVQDSADCSVWMGSSAFGGLAPYSYLWNFGDGDISSDQNPNHTYPDPGPWTSCLTVTDALGCDTTVCMIVVPSCTVGLDENLKFEIQVYPNPSSGIFNVLLPDDAVIRIFDLSGKLIYWDNSQKTDGLVQIDLSQFGKGIYLLHLTTEFGSTTKKLFKN
jgi:PKD repeat protein